MRILFVTPPPYLPNRLHRIRAFDFIRILAKKHEVHLLSITTERKELLEFNEIKKGCKSVKIIYLNPIKSILNCLRFPFLPAEVAYCYSQKVTKEIDNIVKSKKIDLVYLKRLRSAIYLPVIPTEMEGYISTTIGLRKIPRQARNDRISVVLDTTDAMSMFYFRLYKQARFPKKLFYFLEAVRYRRFEKKVMRKIKNWIVCSEIDKNYLESMEISINLHVVPNAVDLDYFHKRLLRYARNDIPRSLLFRGLMDKPVNVTAIIFFVNKVFPLVQKEIEDVQLFIVGPKPHSFVKKLANKKNIFVIGFAKDIRTYIAKTHISVCPILIASGTRHKILQSWAMGQPIVSTTIGAEGLLYRENKNILIADNPREFAQKIITLLKNKKLYDTLAENGRKTAIDKYSFKIISKKLEEIINNVKSSKEYLK